MTTLGINVTDRDRESVPDFIGRVNLVGQQKPKYVHDAKVAMEHAWSEYDEAVDKRIDGVPSYTQAYIDTLRKIAHKAEHEYHTRYALWQQAVVNAIKFDKKHKCSHPKNAVVTDTSGHRWLGPNGPDDNYQEHLICTACGEELPLDYLEEPSKDEGDVLVLF